jgi:hypothetical protein
MQQIKSIWKVLIPGILFTTPLLYLVFTTSPQTQYIPIPTVFIGLFLLFLSLSFLSTLFLKSFRRGVFFGLFVVCSLVLQYYQIRSVLFVVLLASLFFILELLFAKRR